jgi:hypothetical protein
LYNEELCELYFASYIVQVINSRMQKQAGYVAHMGKRDACRVLVVKPEGEIPLGRTRHS